MTKKEKSEQEKKRTEVLSNLVSAAFEKYTVDEIFEAIQNSLYKGVVDELTHKFKENMCLYGTYIIEDYDLMQEHELKKFCKENDIKLIDFFNIKFW